MVFIEKKGSKMQIKTRMRCKQVNDCNSDRELGTKYGEIVLLEAAPLADKEAQNYAIGQTTPRSDVNMFIASEEAFGFFERNKHYDITFTVAAETTVE